MGNLNDRKGAEREARAGEAAARQSFIQHLTCMKPKLDIEKENNPLERELFVGFSRDIYYFQDLLRFHYLVRDEVCQEGVADKEAEIQRVGWATLPVL